MRDEKVITSGSSRVTISNIIVSVLSEGEYNPKSLYVELRKRGYKVSYNYVRVTLCRLVKQGKVMRTKRGYYTALLSCDNEMLSSDDNKNDNKMGGMGFISGVASVDNKRRKSLALDDNIFRVQNIVLYHRLLNVRLVRKSVKYVAGGVIRVDPSVNSIYIRKDDGFSLMELIYVEGYLRGFLDSIRINLDECEVKRFEVLRDFDIVESVDVPRGLCFREFKHNVVFKIYFKTKNRLREEFQFFTTDRPKITMTDLTRILDMRLSGGLSTYELSQHMHAVYNVLQHVLNNQIQMQKMFNKLLQFMAKNFGWKP